MKTHKGTLVMFFSTLFLPFAVRYFQNYYVNTGSTPTGPDTE